MKTREVEGREGGDTEEFIRSNKEQEETEGEGDKERGRERSRELYKEEEEKKKTPLHDSSYTFPQTVGAVKAG